MSTTPKNWLQLFVDAMTEKDPYKRLAMVRELRDTPKPEPSAVPTPSKPANQPGTVRAPQRLRVKASAPRSRRKGHR